MTLSIAAGDLKPVSLVLLAGRVFPGATETYMAMDTPLASFWLALGCTGSDKAIGYARYERRGEEVVTGVRQGLFELTEVLPAGCPAPHPTISLSGVLWTRRAALEAEQSNHSFSLAGG